MPEFYMIYPRKIAKYLNFYVCVFFARKVNKIPEFYMIIARKMAEFYITIARKICFSRILGGHMPSLPPISYAYVLIAPRRQ